MEFAFASEVFRSRVFKNNLCTIGFGIILFIVMLGLLAPIIADDPYKTNLAERLKPPSLKHPFGTDPLGRDVFSRVVHGARTALFVAMTIL